jgi:hypothetical protein
MTYLDLEGLLPRFGPDGFPGFLLGALGSFGGVLAGFGGVGLFAIEIVLRN